MDLGLAGKRALITGSTRGLGAVMARALAAEGARIVVHGRNAEAAAAIASELGGPDRAAVVLGDLGEPGVPDRVADEAIAAFGGIDILVNNAGLFGPDSWENISTEDWLSLYATNVAGPARLCSRLATAMKERSWGRLIHIGSLAAGVAFPMCPNYAATKSALASISSTLAKQFGAFGITSNILGVGTIGNMAEYAAAVGKEGGSADPAYTLMTNAPYGHLNINPMGRSGSPDEVAYAVTMLASPRSSFINGALLRVDGGCVPTIGL